MFFVLRTIQLVVLLGIISVSEIHGQNYRDITFDVIKDTIDSLLIRVKYTPETGSDKKDTVFAIAYINQLDEEEPKAIDVPFYLENGYLVGNLSVKSTIVSLMFVFENGENKINNNNGIGDYYLRSKYNTILRGARASIAYMYSGAWDAKTYYKLSTQRDLARVLYEDEFKAYPQSKRHYFRYYLSSLSTKDTEEKEKYLREINEFGTYSDLTEWELLFLSDSYNYLKDTLNANLFKARLFSEYPTGCWATQVNSMALQRTFASSTDVAIKKKTYEEFKQRFTKPTDEETRRYLELRKGITMLSKMLPYFVKQKQEYEWSREVDELSDEFKIPTLAFGARSLNEIGEWAIAAKYAKRAVDLMEPYLNTTVRKVTERLFFTNREVKVMRENLYADYLFIYGKSLYSQEKYEEACGILAQASIQYSKRLDVNKNQLYIDCLLKADRLDQVVIEMYKYIEIGKVNDTMKELTKNIFYNRDVLNKADAEQHKALLAKIATYFVDEAFTDIVLYDRNRVAVSTSQFKGKIIVIDFWASWCAPCIASLNVLHESKLKYGNDKEVEIVSVNTLEKNDEGFQKAEEFLKKRKFEFVQLFDRKNSTPGQINFSSLPTRIIVDQFGRLRIRQSGLDGTLADQLTELNAMINMLKR